VLQVALGQRDAVQIYGADYPTLDARVSGTTSMSPTWPTRTCWRCGTRSPADTGIYNLGSGTGSR